MSIDISRIVQDMTTQAHMHLAPEYALCKAGAIQFALIHNASTGNFRLQRKAAADLWLEDNEEVQYFTLRPESTHLEIRDDVATAIAALVEALSL